VSIKSIHMHNTIPCQEIECNSHASQLKDGFVSLKFPYLTTCDLMFKFFYQISQDYLNNLKNRPNFLLKSGNPLNKQQKNLNIDEILFFK
jgi:hypothetical protein